MTATTNGYCLDLDYCNSYNFNGCFNGEEAELVQNQLLDVNTMATSSPAPHIEWEEHPVSFFRYRYDSEVGSHGSIMGEKTSKKKKSTIKIKVLNYKGQLRLRGTLYTCDGKLRHVHKLQGKDCNDDGIYERVFQIENESQIIELTNFCILHVTKKNIKDILKERILEGKKMEQMMLVATGFFNPTELTPADELEAQNKAELQNKEIKNELNKVIIQFEAEAYLEQNKKYVQMGDPIFSNQISNQKSATTSDLKICRLSHCSGTVLGGDEVIILCEKVDKKNITVRFFEEGESPWEAFVNVRDMEVHHQYAIVFKTPPYRDVYIESDRTVYIQLMRISDRATSEAQEFNYEPQIDSELKRKRSKQIFNVQDPNNGNSAGGGASRRIIRRANHGLKCEMPSSSSSCEASSSDTPTTAEITDQIVQFDDIPTPNPLLNQLSPSEQQQQIEEFLNSLPSTDGITEPMEDDNIFNLDDLLVTRGLDEYQSDGLSVNQQETEILKSADKVLIDDNVAKLLQKINLKAQSHAEITYRLALSTAKALRSYAVDSDVKRLLQTMKHLISIPDENGDNPIHLAVIHTQLEALRQMLEVLPSDSDVLSSQNHMQQTPLHISVYVDEPEYLSLLLGFGSDPSIQDKQGNTAVHIAAQHGKDFLLEKILRNSKPKLDLKNYEGLTPLHLAVLANSKTCVELLCDAGADVDFQNGTSGRTALHFAVERNYLNIVQLLIEKDADVDVQSFDGTTALHIAVVARSEPLIKILLSAQADPYIENCERYPPLESSSDDEIKDLQSSEDAIDEDYDFRGHNSFNLARDHDRITKLLAGLIPLGDEIFEPSIKAVPASWIDSGNVPDYSNRQTTTGMTAVSPVGSHQRRQSDSGICLSAIEDENWRDVGNKSIAAMDSGIGLGRSEVEAMDDGVKQMLADLLDPAGEKDWKSLSQCIDLDWLIKNLENMASPTKVLLSYVQTLDELQHGLEALNAKEALDIVVTYRKKRGMLKSSSSGTTDNDPEFIRKMAEMNLR